MSLLDRKQPKLGEIKKNNISEYLGVLYPLRGDKVIRCKNDENRLCNDDCMHCKCSLSSDGWYFQITCSGYLEFVVLKDNVIDFSKVKN